MAICLCVINEKGGSGKSSTCFHLSGAFATSGYRVLLIDMDPQASLSRGFLGPTETEQLSVDNTTASIFADHSLPACSQRLVMRTEFERISLCPTNHRLSGFNLPQQQMEGLFQFLLREFVEQIADDFDVVMIDCPPNLYRCSWTAMVAADAVLVPVPPEDFGTQGLPAVHQLFVEVRKVNPHLGSLTHVVCRSDRRLLVHQKFEAQLRQLYAESVFDTVIAESASFKNAVACRLPVEYYASRSRAAGLTRQLSREILARIAVNNERRHGCHGYDKSRVGEGEREHQRINGGSPNQDAPTV